MRAGHRLSAGLVALALLSMLLLAHTSLVNLALLFNDSDPARNGAENAQSASVAVASLSSAAWRDDHPSGAMPIIDIMFHRLTDKFGLVDSGLNDSEILWLLRDVQSTWSKAGVYMRFDTRRALEYETLDLDRAHAYLFYVFGHPRISPNDRKTSILSFAKSTRWIVSYYRDYLEESMPALQALLRSDIMVSELRKRVYNLNQFRELATAHSLNAVEAAFIALAGNTSALASPMAMEDSLAVAGKAMESQRVHLAFRKFYLDNGLSPQRCAEFAEVMKSRPMLFLHYAIGRDVSLTTHEPRRSAWELQNTLSIFPVFYYHDLNGRGSTNWLDVVFRTSSCRERKVLATMPGVDVHCRWGTRSWEYHRFALAELGRMVAHELGHCLGLEHPEPRCTVFPSASGANLMQQQRTFALQTWSNRCTCLRPTCGDCGCNMTDQMYLEFSSARFIDVEEKAKARRAVLARDHREASVASGHVRVGQSVNLAADAHDGVLIESGTILLLAVAPSQAKSVANVRIRPLFAFPHQRIKAEVRVMRNWDCKTGTSGLVVASHPVDLDGNAYRSHWHLDIAAGALSVQEGDAVLLVLIEKGSRVRVAAVPDPAGEMCVFPAAKEALRGAWVMAHVDFEMRE